MKSAYEVSSMVMSGATFYYLDVVSEGSGRW